MKLKFTVLSRFLYQGRAIQITPRKMSHYFLTELRNAQSDLLGPTCPCHLSIVTVFVCNERKEILVSGSSLVVQIALVSWVIIHWCNRVYVPRP
jgi:hypothetical protein